MFSTLTSKITLHSLALSPTSFPIYNSNNLSLAHLPPPFLQPPTKPYSPLSFPTSPISNRSTPQQTLSRYRLQLSPPLIPDPPPFPTSKPNLSLLLISNSHSHVPNPLLPTLNPNSLSKSLFESIFFAPIPYPMGGTFNSPGITPLPSMGVRLNQPPIPYAPTPSTQSPSLTYGMSCCEVLLNEHNSFRKNTFIIIDFFYYYLSLLLG